MVTDSAALAEILAPTFLGGREITTIALQNGEVIFSVALGDADEALPAWEAGRSVVHKTCRWPAISPGHGEPAPALRERHSRRLSDAAGRDEHVTRDAREAIVEIRRARDAVWPARPWQETLDFQLDRTRELIGSAPDRAEVLNALPAESTDRAVQHWFLEWEERQGHVAPASRTEPAWMFFDNDPLLFFPTAGGAETLAYHPPHQGVAGATLERVMTLVESWELRYGAELVANHGTIMQFSVHRPPCTLEESWEIAIEHELIAPDTLWLPGVTLREHARKLINNPMWFVHERP